MTENNKKKNQFSIYWIYGFMSVVIIGGFKLFNSSDTSSIVKNEQIYMSIYSSRIISNII